MRIAFYFRSMLFCASLLTLSGATYEGLNRQQVITLGLYANDAGTMSIAASTFGESLVTLDSSKLRLFARPFATRDSVARERPLSAKIEPAVLLPQSNFLLRHPPLYKMQQFSISVTLARSPGAPGIYDVWPRALDGFGTAEDGTAMPLATRTGFTEAYPEQVSWPDESGNDRELARLRNKFVGRMVYGYGGIAISCRPAWTKFYDASTPVRIASINRERGRLTYLPTGNAASAPYYAVTGFIAYDPLRIVMHEPSAKRYPPLGSNNAVGGLTTQCPAIELADWQMDTTLSLHPAPTGLEPNRSDLHVGMTRDELVWTRGYPNEVGTRGTLRAESTWHYGVGLGRYAVTFRDDRVASFTTPSTL